jgi:hypothetical protein
LQLGQPLSAFALIHWFVNEHIDTEHNSIVRISESVKIRAQFFVGPRALGCGTLLLQATIHAR